MAGRAITSGKDPRDPRDSKVLGSFPKIKTRWGDDYNAALSSLESYIKNFVDSPYNEDVYTQRNFIDGISRAMDYVLESLVACIQAKKQISPRASTRLHVAAQSFSLKLTSLNEVQASEASASDQLFLQLLVGISNRLMDAVGKVAGFMATNAPKDFEALHRLVYEGAQYKQDSIALAGRGSASLAMSAISSAVAALAIEAPHAAENKLAIQEKAAKADALSGEAGNMAVVSVSQAGGAKELSLPVGGSRLGNALKTLVARVRGGAPKDKDYQAGNILSATTEDDLALIELRASFEHAKKTSKILDLIHCTGDFIKKALVAIERGEHRQVKIGTTGSWKLIQELTQNYLSLLKEKARHLTEEEVGQHGDQIGSQLTALMNLLTYADRSHRETSGFARRAAAFSSYGGSSGEIAAASASEEDDHTLTNA